MAVRSDEKRKEQKKEYRKKYTKSLCIEFYINTEQELIQQIDKQPNKSGYIKRLIKDDISNNSLKLPKGEYTTSGTKCTRK